MASSHRQILRSSSIVGGASLVNLLLGLVRMKAAALILGPAGVGIIGLMQNLVTTGATVAGMGVGGAANVQLAAGRAERGDEGEGGVRRALYWATLVLAFAGAAATWAVREPIARLALGDQSYAGAVGWLAVGVALTVALNSQNALFTGLRRIGDLGRVTLISGVLATAAALISLFWLGSGAILFFVLCFPLANVVVASFYIARLPRPASDNPPLSALRAQWRKLVSLGFAMMISGLIVAAGQLVVRSLIKQRLGLVELGLFQAAWTLSMTYVVLVLQAMGADYYPRLSAAMKDRETANRLVNEQTEVVLLLAGPVLLVILGGAPWILHLIYSSEFRDAAALLRWQVLGDLLMVASWPTSFILIAAGDGRTYAAIQLFAILVFVGLTWLLLPALGVEASGVAFLGMYAAYFPAVTWAARRRSGFHLQPGNVRLLAYLAAASAAIFLAAIASPVAAFGLALLIAALMLMLAARRLEEALPAPIASLVAATRRKV
ncbi:MAG TPA: O-antigen translocase [Sphingomicrobium sp.]|nr:O-antigen translocase [Sphingomicrobium sp.]